MENAEIKFRVGDKVVWEYERDIYYSILSSIGFIKNSGEYESDFSRCRHATQEEIEKYFSN